MKQPDVMRGDWTLGEGQYRQFCGKRSTWAQAFWAYIWAESPVPRPPPPPEPHKSVCASL